VARLKKALKPHSRIGLDTSVFIYHVEGHPRYRALTQDVLSAVEDGRLWGVTSVVTLMELTVHPRREGRAGVAREYEALLVHFPNLLLADVTRDVARQAAGLRAHYGVRPADALQVATGLVHGATAFVTNDRRIARVASLLDVFVLDEFAS
jgi:predicted nucleic acid-binding protein